MGGDLSEIRRLEAKWAAARKRAEDARKFCHVDEYSGFSISFDDQVACISAWDSDNSQSAAISYKKLVQLRDWLNENVK